MNYLIIVPNAKFDIGMVQWLQTNVSEEGVHWKVLIDIWERRMVYFQDSAPAEAFRIQFNLP